MEERKDEPLKVTFGGPAKRWTDAAPIGNGRLGAMVWGGVSAELLQLNEDTLWTGIPGDYTDPNAPEALAEVRKLVDNGEYSEATAAAAKLTGDPSEVYQLLGDLTLEFDDLHLKYDEATYHRELDLDTATVRLKYEASDAEFSREYFASHPDQVIATKMSSSKSGSLSFTISLDSKLHHHSYVTDPNRIVMKGSCPGQRVPPKEYEGNEPEGIQFCAVLELQISEGNGIISVLDDKKLKVEGCDWAALLLVASSSFDGPFMKPSESRRDPLASCGNALQSIANLSYSELYARHLSDYQNLFQRVSLQLSKGSANNLVNVNSEIQMTSSSTTDRHFKASRSNEIFTVDRVRSFQYDEDPSLVELLFQFGRYLLISCSRPGTQVANLQGIWNKDTEPAWDCAPHMNINLEMNYWPSLPCNLAECQEPLFDFISSLSTNGYKTAKVNYQADGWVVHHKTDIWAKSSPIQGDVVYALWPLGGAWLCTHLWEHYNYTMDKDFLKNKAYPLLEGCASFLLDWLIKGRGGHLETNPSTSPENSFIAPDGKPASVSYSTTMDMELIREVFNAFAAASEVVGMNDNDLVNRVRSAQQRLRPTKIASDGSIMEWAEEFKEQEVHHRHLSPLYGLFPGHTITVEETPGLCGAAEKTLFKRGEEGPGWSTVWKVSLWARLQNDGNAYRMVKHLFRLVDREFRLGDHEVVFEGGLYSNLFAAHPPFQIDANFGFTAALAEMLVQSTPKDLYLLPALPRDKWRSGQATGLKARGGVTVNIFWKEEDLSEVHVWSDGVSSIEYLHYRGSSVAVKICHGRVHTFDGKLKHLNSYSLSEAGSAR